MSYPQLNFAGLLKFAAFAGLSVRKSLIIPGPWGIVAQALFTFKLGQDSDVVD